MNNTLADTRQEVYDRLNWDPAGSMEAEARINRRIRSAIKDLATEAPSGLFETVDHIWLEPDVVSASSGDTVALLQATDYGASVFPSGDKGDSWVFRTTYQRDEYTGATQPWDTKRAWDGRWVELTDADGQVFWAQIRTVWQETFNVGSPIPGKTPDIPASGQWSEFRFSVVSPWRSDLGSGPFTWRVVTPAYNLPQQMVRLNSMYLYKARRELEVISPDEVEDRALDAVHPTSDQAEVLYAYQRPPMRLQAPAVAPSVAHSGEVQWVGPEPPGRFSYILTYTWGKLHATQTAPGVSRYSDNTSVFDVSPLAMSSAEGTNRIARPRWESAPSPESEVIEVAYIPNVEPGGPPTPPSAVEVTLPNIEYILGFLLAGTGSSGNFSRASLARSGIHVRIYRVRWTEDFTNYERLGTSDPGFHIPTLHKLDLRAGEPQLLAEVRIDPDNEGVFVDDGRILPDASRPLQSQGIFPTFTVYPRPQEEDRLDVRYVAAPKLPVLDTDIIPVNNVGYKAIVNHVVAMEAANDHNLSSTYRRLYQEAIQDLNSAADLQPSDQVTYRKPARAGREHRTPSKRWWGR